MTFCSNNEFIIPTNPSPPLRPPLPHTNRCSGARGSTSERASIKETQPSWRKGWDGPLWRGERRSVSQRGSRKKKKVLIHRGRSSSLVLAWYREIRLICVRSGRKKPNKPLNIHRRKLPQSVYRSDWMRWTKITSVAAFQWPQICEKPQ